MPRHRLALGLLVLLIVGWALTMSWVLERARPDDRLQIVVFPIGTAREAAMAVVSRADGRLVRETWWPWAYVAEAPTPTFGDRMRAAGVWWVLPPTPFGLAMIGGCGFAPFTWRASADDA